MWKRYATFCAVCQLQALPVTSVFLIDVVNSRGSSTKSLSGTVRVSAGPTLWLNYDDELKLRYLIAQLRGLDFTDSNAVSALQFNMGTFKNRPKMTQ
jgi:hypothetical protein